MSQFQTQATLIDQMDHISFYQSNGEVHFRECSFKGMTTAEQERLVAELNEAIALVKEEWLQDLKTRLINKLSNA